MAHGRFWLGELSERKVMGNLERKLFEAVRKMLGSMTGGCEALGERSTMHLGRGRGFCFFISIANNEDEFLRIISEEGFADNGFVKEDINLPRLSIELTDFITENDFDLSSIADAYTFDLEDKRLRN